MDFLDFGDFEEEVIPENSAPAVPDHPENKAETDPAPVSEAEHVSPKAGPAKKAKDNGKEVTKQFLKELERQLKTGKVRSARQLGKWISSGRKLNYFKCRADVLPFVCERLMRDMTPYMLVSGTGGENLIFIRSADKESIKVAAKEILEEASKKCGIVTFEDANLHALQSKESDKAMVTIYGLSEAERLYLQEECSRVLPNGEIGLARYKDGTYAVTCHGKSSMAEPGKKSLYEAAAEAVLVAGGDKRRDIESRYASEAEFRHLRAAGFFSGGKDRVFVVGDGMNYVEIEKTRFYACYAVVRDHSVDLIREEETESSDVRYEKKLRSALRRITGKKCLFRERDVENYFLRPRRDVMKSIIGEQTFIAHASPMIMNNPDMIQLINSVGIWDRKLLGYMGEMKKLMTAVKNEQVPKGYTRDQVLDLIGVTEAFAINPRSFAKAISRIENLEVRAKDAEPNRVHDIVKYMESLGEDAPDREQQAETRESRESDISFGEER